MQEILTYIQIFFDWLSRLTDFIPIDLILFGLIFFMFYRFIWVMFQRTRVWDNLSRSLIAVFASTGAVYLFVTVATIFDSYGAEPVLLWLIRISLLVSITWCQFELNKELKKVPNILFVRDRQWVHRRINNIELIRTLLLSHSDTPSGLIPALNAELEEMYRFKEIVWEDDQKKGVVSEPEWTKNPYYVESHGRPGDPAERDLFATLLEHPGTATPGDDYPGEGGNRS